MPKAPGKFHPVRNMQRVQSRRDFVLKEMAENGYISQASYESGKAIAASLGAEW